MSRVSVAPSPFLTVSRARITRWIAHTSGRYDVLCHDTANTHLAAYNGEPRICRVTGTVVHDSLFVLANTDKCVGSITLRSCTTFSRHHQFRDTIDGMTYLASHFGGPADVFACFEATPPTYRITAINFDESEAAKVKNWDGLFRVPNRNGTLSLAGATVDMYFLLTMQQVITVRMFWSYRLIRRGSGNKVRAVIIGSGGEREDQFIWSNVARNWEKGLNSTSGTVLDNRCGSLQRKEDRKPGQIEMMLETISLGLCRQESETLNISVLQWSLLQHTFLREVQRFSGQSRSPSAFRAVHFKAEADRILPVKGRINNSKLNMSIARRIKKGTHPLPFPVIYPSYAKACHNPLDIPKSPIMSNYVKPIRWTSPSSFSFALRHSEGPTTSIRQVFIRPNFSKPEPEPPLPYTIPKYDAGEILVDFEPKIIDHFSWFKNAHPHFPFMPTREVFAGPIFGRLAYTHYTIPIVKTPHGFHLKESVMAQWFRLETALIWVYETIAKKFTVPMSFSPRPPKVRGYTRVHKHRHWAVRCAMTALDAFRELIAICLMTMAFNSKWETCLQAHSAQFSTSWVDDLRQGLANPTLVGALVDLTDNQWQRLITTVALRTPTWFLACSFEPGRLVLWRTRDEQALVHWPTAASLEEFLHKASECLDPTLFKNEDPIEYYSVDGTCNDEGDWDLRLHYRLQRDVIHGMDIDISPSHSSADTPPPPATFPDTAEEPWKEFFAVRQAENAQTIAAETPEQTALRNSRFEVDMPENSSRAPRVFEWVKRQGYWCREYVSPGFVEDRWGLYNIRQRRFDDVYNEWDLCEGLAPETFPDNLSDPGDGQVDDIDLPAQQLSKTGEDLLAENSQSDSLTHLEDGEIEEDAHTTRLR
ncbi:hypothetical protein BDN72DRAFT_866021, partial [Pluteus cervinus]